MRDHEGDVLMASCLTMEGISDVDVAEALGARHGILTAMEADLRNIILKVDCLKLFTHLRDDKREASPFGMIVQDNLVIAAECSCFSFSHVRRSGNVVAHSLAKLSFSMDGLRVWLEEVPPDM